MTPGTKVKNKFDPNATDHVIDAYTGRGFFRLVDLQSGKSKDVHQELLRTDYMVVEEAKQEGLDL